jgi:hypothetical protein
MHAHGVIHECARTHGRQQRCYAAHRPAIARSRSKTARVQLAWTEATRRWNVMLKRRSAREHHPEVARHRPGPPPSRSDPRLMRRRIRCCKRDPRAKSAIVRGARDRVCELPPHCHPPRGTGLSQHTHVGTTLTPLPVPAGCRWRPVGTHLEGNFAPHVDPNAATAADMHHNLVLSCDLWSLKF